MMRQMLDCDVCFFFLFSDKLYVEFHDECWGVPVYDDKYVIFYFMFP